MSTTQFGETVRRYRKKAELSLRTAAARAGISPSQLSKLEHGLSVPSRRTVESIAYALNVDKDELMTLAGYVPDDAVTEVLNSLDELLYVNVREAPQAYEVSRPREFLPELYALISDEMDSRFPDVTAEEVEVVTRELYGAFELSLKRLKRRG
jgi:transcriptional regulator with XRE-family HTH domain